jgi:hypothetical protein
MNTPTHIPADRPRRTLKDCVNSVGVAGTIAAWGVSTCSVQIQLRRALTGFRTASVRTEPS